MDDLIGHSIAYRVAMGARAGQKAFTLQTVPPQLGAQSAMQHPIRVPSRRLTR
jgi:hypothetical protein